MSRRTPRRAYPPDPAAPGRTCDMPGCTAAGEFRAPKSRASLQDYWWFCLEHVRGYNAAWDYYKGMSAGEIEAQVRADTAWQRPTWPLGRLGGRFDETVLRDALGAIHGGLGGRHRHDRAGDDAAAAPEELREPLATLGLAWPVTLEAVKQRYHVLAKQHHPDANGGDRAAEERLKVINLAYAALRVRLSEAPHPPPAAHPMAAAS